MIKSASEKLSEMAHNRYFALPYWHKLEPIEVRQSEVVDNTMKWLRESASASLGLPMAFATGSGEATNRATLGTLQKFMEFSLKDMVGRVCAQFKQHIFKRICAYNNFKEIPDIIWGDIGAESIDDKATRLQNYVKVGALDPKVVETFALESEKLNVSPKQKVKDNYEADIVKDGEQNDKSISGIPYQMAGAQKGSQANLPSSMPKSKPKVQNPGSNNG
jgi:hypothetical protein